MHKILSNSKKTFFSRFCLSLLKQHISSEHKRSDLNNHTRPVQPLYPAFIKTTPKSSQEQSNLLSCDDSNDVFLPAAMSFLSSCMSTSREQLAVRGLSIVSQLFLSLCPTACTRHCDGWLGTSPKRVIASLAGKKLLLGSGYIGLASDDSVVGLGSSSAAKLIRKPLYTNFYRKANLCRNFLRKP